VSFFAAAVRVYVLAALLSFSARLFARAFFSERQTGAQVLPYLATSGAMD
jgi:hypothetical protein